MLVREMGSFRSPFGNEWNDGGKGEKCANLTKRPG